jgi:peptidoglycan/LPS O-acetylase OafA/YrhL
VLVAAEVQGITGEGTQGSGRLAYAPGMDGLRAVAVLAVIVFHAGASWLPGGFLGVDVFFVISGFLITSLLVAEHRGTGRLAFGAFWARRARRLLPALLLLLAVITAWALSPWPDPVQLRAFPDDAMASLFYAANWHFAAHGASYFTQFSAPSPLQHLWSLAIEEQFYLVWPLVLAAFLALRRTGRRQLLALSLGGAAASIALMAVLYNPSHPSAVYFQTDTHAFGLLLGAAAALCVAGGGDRLGRACTVLAPAALAGMLACFAVIDGHGAFAYRGGIALAALVTVPVVVASSRPGVVSRLLAFRPLVWIGLVSYGLYLWHWPIWTVLTDARLGLDPVSGTLVRSALLLAVTLASYLGLELPIRRGALPRWSARLVAPAAVGGLAAAILVVPLPPPVFTPPVSVSGSAISASLTARDTPRVPRVMLVGDSTAASAASGFFDVARGDYQLVPAGMPPHPDSYCPLDIWLDAVREPGRGVHVHPPSPECDWFHMFPTLVRAYDPSVVVVMFSLWDTLPHHVNGRWLESGTPEWAAELQAAANCAISELGANGARVELVLAPRTIEQPGFGAEYLSVVYQSVAAGDPTRVGVVDARGPTEAGSTATRWDGIHYTPDGARLLAGIARPALAAALAQPRLLPATPSPCQPPG